MKHKKIFLIDSLGALISAFFLGIVLVRFEIAVGMPKEVLIVLAILACILAFYSFISYLFVIKNWQFYIRIIALVNLVYCCLTIGFLTYFHREITVLGCAYFFIEIIVILILANIEINVAKN
ncbi:hypothetical protein [Flavobacterium piscisymbiosum]|uniref:Uncharacterized protein n=1 Tax=Flavobacterium piscisymbiosum TaxID=2893753 RepID=A0ABS8MI52_9FLAO|nr:hypothetical protein [Flavobacterium sp. F-30]MCC9065172.1 hypothetical protein [Flavobacterium sp. F-30]